MKDLISVRLRVFLSAYEASGQVYQAAKAAGIARSTHYKALLQNLAYRAAFEETTIRALRLEADRLEKSLQTPKP
jgi:hypothetical protein